MAPANNKRHMSNNNNIGKQARAYNRFADLVEEEDSSENIGINEEEPSITSVKIPPIKVISQSCEVIHEMCASVGITDYNVKKMSIGVKICCDSDESHQKLTSWLQTKGIEYFTHPKRTDRLFKAVLYGLDHGSPEKIKSELLKLGLKCVDIKRITKTRFAVTEAIFIVYFERGSTNVKELSSNVRSLFHTIIRWDHHRKPKGTVVQCRKCQLFGHGESNCHVKSKCALCGGAHLTSDCNNKNKVSCVNCGLDHPAFDKKCPQRLLYQEIQSKSRRNNKNRSPRVSHNERSVMQLSGNNFPPLTSNHVPLNHPTTAFSYADAAKQKPHNNNNKDDLFSVEEINCLLLDLLPRLKMCRSKEEQFNAITQIAIKYLYNFTH